MQLFHQIISLIFPHDILAPGVIANSRQTCMLYGLFILVPFWFVCTWINDAINEYKQNKKNRDDEKWREENKKNLLK